jgi:hypothetical protein
MYPFAISFAVPWLENRRPQKAMSDKELIWRWHFLIEDWPAMGARVMHFNNSLESSVSAYYDSSSRYPHISFA